VFGPVLRSALGVARGRGYIRFNPMCRLRRGEVAGLRGDDFDFGDAFVRVTKQLHVDGPQRWTGPPKWHARGATG
jgi:integrase